jgi:hypothetical protein
MVERFGGLDVSMDRLDVMVLPDRAGFSAENTAAGWAELIRRLSGSPLAAIGIEPSGGYGPVGSAHQPRTSSDNLPAPAGSWPRTIASMRD